MGVTMSRRIATKIMTIGIKIIRLAFEAASSARTERRWRLKLDKDTALELPADNEVAALEEISRDAELAKRVADGRATLDFRGPGRVAIRPAPDAAASATPPNTGS